MKIHVAKKYLLLTAVLIGSIGVLAGCTTKEERMAKQEAYRKIGITAMEEGKYIEAQTAFNNALAVSKKIGANEMDICYYKAAAQYAAGSLNDAIETYTVLLDYDDKNSDAYFLRGCVYLKTNESAKALEDFSKSVKYGADDEIYLEIYHSLNGAGYEAEGLAFLEEVLEKKPGKVARNYTVRGQIYQLKGSLDKAEEQLLTAIDMGDTIANIYLAQVYEEKGDLEKEEACIDAYIAVYPDSSIAYNKKGCDAMESKDYTEAIRCFNEGLALDEVTNEQELRSNLIAAYEYNGDFTSAKSAMEEYLVDYPEDTKAAREYLFLNRSEKEESETE